MLDAPSDQQPACRWRWSCWRGSCWRQSTASRWILLTFLVCRCRTFRVFLPSAYTMLLIKAVSFAKTTNFFSYPDDSFPSWVNIPACNFLPILNSLTPCAHMVFGSYCPAWKPWLSYGMVVVAVFTHPISRCWTAAVGKGIASSCPVHLSAQNLGFYFRRHRDFLFFLFLHLGGHMLTDPSDLEIFSFC